MPTTTVGYKDNPSYEDDYLLETVGYCERLWVEQEGNRDSIRFTLRIYYYGGSEPGGAGGVFEFPTAGSAAGYLGFGKTAHQRLVTFILYMDVNTTVALAQLQLLRDAMSSTVGMGGVKLVPMLVRVHYNFLDDAHEQLHPYFVGLLYLEGEDPIVADDYYLTYHDTRMMDSSWYTHISEDD